VSDPQRQRSQAAVAAQAEAEFREACTFQPDTSASRCGGQLFTFTTFCSLSAEVTY
jgi:hypothetical protein